MRVKRFALALLEQGCPCRLGTAASRRPRPRPRRSRWSRSIRPLLVAHEQRPEDRRDRLALTCAVLDNEAVQWPRRVATGGR
jgi:hypothetical protein